MSVNNLIPDKIEIVDFKIINGEINNPFDFNSDNIVGHTFNVEFELGFSLSEKLVKADFKVFVETKSKEKNTKESKGTFHFVFVYHIDNLEELAEQKTKGEINFHGSLGNALSSITYSTSRGILMTRFQGTSLENFILPVLDPNILLKD